MFTPGSYSFVYRRELCSFVPHGSYTVLFSPGSYTVLFTSGNYTILFTPGNFTMLFTPGSYTVLLAKEPQGTIHFRCPWGLNSFVYCREIYNFVALVQFCCSSFVCDRDNTTQLKTLIEQSPYDYSLQ